MFLGNTGRNCKKCCVDQHICGGRWFYRNIHCEYRLLDPLKQIDGYISTLYRSMTAGHNRSTENPQYVIAKLFNNMVTSLAYNKDMVDFERLKADDYAIRMSLIRNMVKVLHHPTMEETRYDNINALLLKEYDDSPRYQLSLIDETEEYSAKLLVKDLFDNTEFAVDYERLGYKAHEMMQMRSNIGLEVVSKQFIESYGFIIGGSSIIVREYKVNADIV